MPLASSEGEGDASGAGAGAAGTTADGLTRLITGASPAVAEAMRAGASVGFSTGRTGAGGTRSARGGAAAGTGATSAERGAACRWNADDRTCSCTLRNFSWTASHLLMVSWNEASTSPTPSLGVSGPFEPAKVGTAGASDTSTAAGRGADCSWVVPFLGLSFPLAVTSVG